MTERKTKFVEHVKLKSRDGQATCECPERYAVALVASGKWVRVETPQEKAHD